MRVRAALAALSALVLVLTVVFALAGKAEGEAPGAPRSGQILAEPNPPHRVLGAPLDAATLDVAPVRKHKAHPVGTRNLPRPVRTVVHRAVHSLGTDAFLRCVIHHESRGNPRAENPTSTASGLFQFIDGSWRSYARAAGYTQWRHAADAPASVQWSVAQYVVTHYGKYPWKGTHCGGGT